MSAHRTRRQLLGPARASDPHRLARLLELEQMAIDAYALALASGQLNPAAAELARQVREQERAHAVALARHVAAAPSAQAGQAAPSDDIGPAPIVTPARLQRALARAGIHVPIARLHTQREWLSLLDRIEGALAGAHFRAVRELESAEAAALTASILADEAQHQTVLVRLRHPRNVLRSVPYSVVPADASIQL